MKSDVSQAWFARIAQVLPGDIIKENVVVSPVILGPFLVFVCREQNVEYMARTLRSGTWLCRWVHKAHFKAESLIYDETCTVGLNRH